ncbi:MAG: hypothetical protein Q9217_005284 [Psora testacea]
MVKLTTPSWQSTLATVVCELSNQSRNIVNKDCTYVNEARALRVTELMRDYQDIHRRVSQYQANPKPDDYNEMGYSTLRQCHNDAKSLLNAPFSAEMLHPPTDAVEAAKRQLQRIILDASARRLMVQKIFLRATTAVKWIDARNAILRGGNAKNGDVSKLKQIDSRFSQDLNSITDQRIVNAFRAKDQQAGYWLDDDPALSTILEWIGVNY